MPNDTLVYQARKGSSIVECAGPEDAAALGLLDARCFQPPWPASHYQQQLGAPERILLLVRAAVGGQPVALLDARQIVDEVHVFRVATAPTHQRRGHGRALMTAMIEEARQRNCREILLDVGAGNGAASALYRSLGFVEVGRRRAYYSDGDDAVLMNLPLL